MKRDAATTANLLSPAYKFVGAANTWDNWGKLATLVKHLAMRNLALRYRASALGFLWSLLYPMLLMAVYTFVFRFVFQASVPGIPYPAFFLTGILAWNFVSNGAMSAAVSLLEGKALINKVAFPRVALPISAVLAGAINYLMTLPILIGFNLLLGVAPTWQFLLFPFAFILLFLMALGVGLLLAALIPLFRDLQHLVEVAFISWFLLTPVLYPVDQVKQNVGAGFSRFYAVNPMVGLIDFVHGIFFGQPISGTRLAMSIVGILLLLSFGYWVFSRLAANVAEN